MLLDLKSEIIKGYNSTTVTAWEVLLDFVKSGDSSAQEILLENWPKNVLEKEKLCKRIMDTKAYQNSALLMTKTVETIVYLNKFEFWAPLCNDPSSKLYRHLFDSNLITKEIEKTVFELLFFRIIGSSHKTLEENFQIIASHIFKREYNFKHTEVKQWVQERGGFKEVTVPIDESGDISMFTALCKIKSSAFIEKVLDYSSKCGLDTINALIRLSLDPKVKNLNKFVNSIESITDAVKKEHFTAWISYSNWLLYRTFNLSIPSNSVFDDSTFTDTYIATIENSLANLNNLLDIKPETATYFYFWRYFDSSKISAPKKLLHFLQINFESLNPREVLSAVLILVLGRLASSLNDQTLSEDELKLLHTIILNRNYKGVHIDFNILLIYIHLNKFDDLIALRSNTENTYLQSDEFVDETQLNDQAIVNLVNHINSEISRGHCDILIKVLSNMIINSASKKQRLDNSTYKHLRLQEIRPNTDITKFSTAIVQLSDPNISALEANNVVTFINTIVNLKDNYLNALFSVIAVYNPSNHNLEPLLLLLDKKVSKDNSSLRSKYEYLMRNYVGATKSKLIPLI